MTCSKSASEYFNYDMFKVSKMTILIKTCSKLAMVNKAIHDAFKSQKTYKLQILI